MTWNDQFLDLFRSCLDKFKSGNKDFNTYYSEPDLEFLRSIGCKPRELFDFVEDLGDEGSPSESTALLVAAVRRDYFLVVQEEVHSDREITQNDLPTFGDKLTGLRDHGNIPMADFLRNVWASGTDDLKIANYVKNYSA